MLESIQYTDYAIFIVKRLIINSLLGVALIFIGVSGY